MQSKKQSDSSSKRTSHYYKKKLRTSQEEISGSQLVQKIGQKIQKKPKQAKLRAKQARQRKKVYIEKLESRINFLQKQLKIYKDKSSAIQSSNSAFINLTKPQKPTETLIQVRPSLKKAESTEYTEEVIKLAGIQNAFRRLYGAVQMKNRNEAESSIEMLRNKFGVSGEERIKWFQELLLKIVSIMMPMHCRLLLENCQNRQEFYKLIGCGESMKQDRKLYFDKDTISTLCQSRPAMVEIKEQYKKIILNIAQLSESMIREAKNLQFQIDKIQNSMNPLFVGKILVDLDIERKKHQNLNEIFPVNFYKEELKKMKEDLFRFKLPHDEICYKQMEEEDMIQRISGFSDEQNYLISMLSQ